MVLLLDCLKRRENWPEEFISALEQCGHQTIADGIRKEYDSLRCINSKSARPFYYCANKGSNLMYFSFLKMKCKKNELILSEFAVPVQAPYDLSWMWDTNWIFYTITWYKLILFKFQPPNISFFFYQIFSVPQNNNKYFSIKWDRVQEIFARFHKNMSNTEQIIFFQFHLKALILCQCR